ncbi:diaminohydroxyphosphoribosylaminopyrimidine deaminase [Trichococcus patagoniensis]|uniref:Riboflavin biosynthesis protein RibD n=1 Tax=Trichococcus patagoniensis TaxID=382641 RepID=A0A2T5IIK6_9LACT|nr:bifunctional diaminohydroxyphosphoribosylaminopyrimidine deaminase/5-amino-6-(5-phosphoribosylamino)uracil reductase RibD [Trichococcus patagoniensis]PTQ83670.1 diaminohydroxyphosphoribosylaminopyrimidine deaminase [Trichococcus patagoniensis]
MHDLDTHFMQMALELAEKGRGAVAPNPMVGAVIVKDGRIIGSGYHEKFGEGHAEVNAFRSATEDVTGATIYVTLEPCSHYGKTPPCSDKIIEKKIGRVVIAALDPNPLVSGRGVKKLQAAGIEVVTGVLAEESSRLNEIFMKYIVTKEPFVVMKAAMSLDGKIATRTGESQWITGPAAREQVHHLRSALSGIMVGVQTVITDDPQLTSRIPGGKNPVRIIVDSTLRIPLEANVLKNQDAAKTIIATTARADRNKVALLEEAGIEIVTVPDQSGQTDLKAFVKILGERGIDSILLEGGATLNFSALQANIVDKVQVYIAPKLIGGETAKTPVGGAGIEKLSQAFSVIELKASAVGEDILLEGYISKNEQ